MKTTDVDDEMDAWWDVQQAGYIWDMVNAPRHRCSPDMPPCPECEDRQEEEQWREFGT